jgi:hypothetical protein
MSEFAEFSTKSAFDKLDSMGKIFVSWNAIDKVKNLASRHSAKRH